MFKIGDIVIDLRSKSGHRWKIVSYAGDGLFKCKCLEPGNNAYMQTFQSNLKVKNND